MPMLMANPDPFNVSPFKHITKNKKINLIVTKLILITQCFSLFSLKLFTVGDTSRAARAVKAEDPGDSVNSGCCSSFQPPDPSYSTCQEPITFCFKEGKVSPQAQEKYFKMVQTFKSSVGFLKFCMKLAINTAFGGHLNLA